MIGLKTQCLWVTLTPIPGLHSNETYLYVIHRKISKFEKKVLDSEFEIQFEQMILSVPDEKVVFLSKA